MAKKHVKRLDTYSISILVCTMAATAMPTVKLHEQRERKRLASKPRTINDNVNKFRLM